MRVRAIITKSVGADVTLISPVKKSKLEYVKTKVIISIGTAGAGKTTTLTEFARKNGYIYVGTDQVREELNLKFDDYEGRWNEVRRRVKEALDSGKTVVVDAVFGTEYRRKNFIEFVRENGADKVQGVFIDTPPEVARHRVIERGKTEIRRSVECDLEKIDEGIEEPDLCEGFDGIFKLNENQEMVEAEVKHGEKILKR